MKIVKSKTTNSISFLALLAISSLFIIASCKKSNNDTNTNGTGSSSLAVVNASASSAMYDVYIDSSKISQNGQLGYGSTTGTNGGVPYQSITSGAHAVKLTANGSTWVTDTTVNFANSNAYSVFAYDTVNSSGKLQTLVLHDNLTAPASDKSEIRFLNLSPNSTALNVLLVNTDTTASKDTILLSNISYVGNTSISTDSLAAFATVNPGTYKVFLNSGQTKLNLFTNNSVTLGGGKIYTMYAKGYIGGVNGTDSLGLGTIPNN